MVEGNGTSLASHCRCLILGLDFPTSHGPSPTYSTELQWSIPFPKYAPIPSSCGLYWLQYEIRQSSNTEVPTFLPQADSSEQRFGNGRRRFKRKVRINLSIITSLPPNSFLWRQISLRQGNTMEHDRKKMKMQGSRGQSGTGGLQSHKKKKWQLEKKDTDNWRQ